MTKTIEEAAKRFADMKTTKQAGSSVERDKKALLMTQFFHFALEELPLSERLTAEEKERVRANYADTKDIHARCVRTMSKNHIADLHNEYSKGLNMGIMIVLKHLFGKEFFKEE